MPHAKIKKLERVQNLPALERFRKEEEIVKRKNESIGK